MLKDCTGILGRRVETDGSWTAYHVFTGRPATIGGELMIDLSRDRATSIMLANNRHQSVALALMQTYTIQ